MITILITEDSSFQRRNLQRILQGAGYHTEEAEDGRKALIKLEKNIPDCILIDLLMPEMNGFELLKALREQYPTLPAIVVTSDIQDSTYAECMALGAKAVVNKPIKPELLFQKITTVLSAHNGNEQDITQ